MNEAFYLKKNNSLHRFALVLMSVLLLACQEEEPSDDINNGSHSSASSSGNSAPKNRKSVSRAGLAARLSKFEYTNSVKDVLEVDLLPMDLDESMGGIPDDTGDGVFKHLADNQRSVEQHALAYFRVAESVTNRADISQLLQRNSVCRQATRTCGKELISTLGRKLYRRPLDQQEVNSILSVYQSAIDEKSDYEEAARWALMALLQAPQFLFRMDNELVGSPNQPRNLNAYELASRLAAFLWVSVPDDKLLQAAANKSLLNEKGLEQQLSRMLSDPKARRFTEVFATDFSRARFASFEGATDADRVALNESIVASFQDHFWTQQAGIADIFTTTRYIVNPIVADILDINISGSKLQAVDVSGLPERVGLMSHPGVIAGMGDREVGSFVNRGKYLMERLLCEHPIDVPAGFTAAIDQFTADTTGFNEHERAEVRMTRGECWGCHKQFEPLAFGFSRFDGAGRYLGDRDDKNKPLPLDGWVPTFEAVEPRYDDVESYMQILATNQVVQTCMTEHFIDFATSRIGDAVGKYEAEYVGHDYLSGGATLTSMVDAVVRSSLFQTILTSPRGTK